jgi:hypothetical protein
MGQGDYLCNFALDTKCAPSLVFVVRVRSCLVYWLHLSHARCDFTHSRRELHKTIYEFPVPQVNGRYATGISNNNNACLVSHYLRTHLTNHHPGLSFIGKLPSMHSTAVYPKAALNSRRMTTMNRTTNVNGRLDGNMYKTTVYHALMIFHYCIHIHSLYLQP